MQHCNIHKQQKQLRRSGKIIVMALALMILNSFRPAQAQEVRIHHLGLGDGDCTVMMLIDSVTNIFRGNHLDTVTVLIDAQRKSTNASTEIVSFIDSNIGKYRKTIDYVILSHLHIDHYGNMVDVLKKLRAKGYLFSKVLDRTAYQFPSLAWNLDSLDNCYDHISSPGKLSATANAYVNYIKSNFHTYSRPPINPGRDLFYGKGFMNLKFICVAANGATLDTSGLKTVSYLPYKYIWKKNKKFKTDDRQPKSENDLSLAFLLSFQGFTYFTGGDVGGPGSGGNYCDGETPISEYLKARIGANFHFCSFKVSHHGSAESSDASFLTRTNPTLAVVPAALRSYGSSKKPLPTCATLTNLRARVSRIEYTFVPKNTSSWQQYCKYNNLKNTRDVTIRVAKLPGYDTIKIHITSRNRGTKYALADSVTLDSVNCTKTHPVINLAMRPNSSGIHMAAQPRRDLPAAEAERVEVPSDAEKPLTTGDPAAFTGSALPTSTKKTAYEKSQLRR